MFKVKPILLKIFGIEVAAGIILLVIGFFTDPSEMLDEDMSLRGLFYLLGVVLFFGPFIAGLALYSIGIINRKQIDKIRTSGLRGSAKVVSVSPPTGKLNNLRRVDIVMDVDIPGKTTYRTEHGEYFDLNSIDKVKPGMTLFVLVDPNNRNKLMIVW